MPNLLMELDSSGIKSTSEIATPLQSASALEELNQKRNLAAGMRSPLTEGEGSRGQGEPGPSQALFTCPAYSLSVANLPLLQQHQERVSAAAVPIPAGPKLCMQNSSCHLPPFFWLPMRSNHSTASTRSSLLSHSPLNAVLGVVPPTLEMTPEQLGQRGRWENSPGCKGCSGGHPQPRFHGTGTQVLAASTKPQSTALAQPKGSTDPFPT